MSHVHEQKQLCAGCGVCAGICSSIKMVTNNAGQYAPQIDENKCVNCGKCVAVCPAMLSEVNKEQIHKQLWGDRGQEYRKETGYFDKAYEGFVEECRGTSASGGFCTSLLIQILENRYVDSIYCAFTNSDSDKLYVSKRLCTKDEILKSAGSAYYPIELSSAIREIIYRKEKTAVVCLPCQATALRLAMKKNKILREYIVFIVGLVCGGMPGKNMVEYIATDYGVNMNQVDKITFREKDSGIKCNNCQIKFYSNTKEILTSRYHGETFGLIYLNHLFHNPVCNICTDIFAEEADIVFGDAWFPEYKNNELGTSICISRNVILSSIMENLGKDIHQVDIKRVIRAQSNVGLTHNKKELAYYYRNYYANHGYTIGMSKSIPLKWKRKLKIIAKIKIQEQAVKCWTGYKEQKYNFSQLSGKIDRLVRFKRRLK